MSAEKYNNKKLNENLTRLMREFKIDDRKLSHHTGVAFTTIARLRNDSSTNPTTAVLLPLASFFNITVSQLIGEEELYVSNIPESYIPSSKITNVPIVEWERLSDNITHNIYETDYWIVTEQKVSDKTFAVKINSDTFGVVIRKNSIVIVDPEKSYQSGDLLLIKFGINVTIRKVIIDGDVCYTKMLDPEIRDIKELNEMCNVMGAIIEIRYSAKDIL